MAIDHINNLHRRFNRFDSVAFIGHFAGNSSE